MKLRSCVKPNGTFSFCVHKPSYPVTNLRQGTEITTLGVGDDGLISNEINFPDHSIQVDSSDPVYEIANPFPFKGATFINGRWAQQQATSPLSVNLPSPADVSFSQALNDSDADQTRTIMQRMPTSVLLALATTSTDPNDLIILAEISCALYKDENGQIIGLHYDGDTTQHRAQIHNHALFEAVANNPALPEQYKQAMVLRPGVQGGSEIIGDFHDSASGAHVFEYLRRNSYIPWGHYAANMANDTIRYSLQSLTLNDMIGMRHLYYQRTYQLLAADLGIKGFPERQQASATQLEILRQAILAKMATGAKPTFTATLWGWNYGFDLAASQYRLNASHQMIHQQYAMIPASVDDTSCFACGDLIADFCCNYLHETGKPFFATYLQAIATNKRLDGGNGESNLSIFEDDNVMAFVPKAQTSQWEVQIITKNAVGNILEADKSCRASLDKAFFITVKALHGLGLKMMCTIEYNKRFTDPSQDQRLLYSLSPRLPHSPGAFSETQQRWINGHFPEDFATALRAKIPKDS